MDEEELKGVDYWSEPLQKLMRHPDYSPHAHRVISAIMSMTTAQIEQIDIRGEHNGR